MKFRQVIHFHAESLGLKPVQGIELSKILASDPQTELRAVRPGPGGGAKATPYNTTKFILAVLSGGPQTSANAVVSAAYVLPVQGTDSGAAEMVESSGRFIESPVAVCRITGAPAFGMAVQKILASPALADKIQRIDFVRGCSDATIVFRDGQEQRFVTLYDEQHPPTGLRVVASIDGALLAEIARDIDMGPMR
jgi:hypothetical protein